MKPSAGSEIEYIRFDKCLEKESSKKEKVVAEEAVVVTSVAAGLAEGRAGRVLHDPEVAVSVVAFDLVGGRRRAPDEAVRKTSHASSAARVALNIPPCLCPMPTTNEHSGIGA